MSAPFMPLYVGDYLRDTRGLTAEEHGAYLLLLMSMWNAGGELPHDDRKLARFASCSPSRWAKLRAGILGFFELVDGVVRHKRLGVELKKAQEKSIRNAKNGSLGGRAKSLNSQDSDVAPAKPALQHHARGLPEPESEEEREDAAPPPAGGEALPPVPKPKSSRRSSETGGSKPPGGRRAADPPPTAEDIAAAEAVLADELASDEDRFFALKPILVARGIRWSMAMKIATEADCDYGEAFRAVRKALGSRDPTSYLGGISRARREEEASVAPAAPSRTNGAPSWVVEFRADGENIQSEGPNRWRWRGCTYDDEQNEVGW